MQPQDTPKGLILGASAYTMWGFLPLYLKTLQDVPAAEVVAHRVLWALPVAAAVLLATGRSADLRAALRSPRTLAMAAVTAALISLNWGVYVWAVANDRTLDAALGYYINPLFSIFLGFVLLGERLDRAQVAAIALAVCAVAILTWATGRLPLVSIVLALSFALYGYFKKSLPVGPNQGFLLEVLILTPFALVYAIWLGASGQGHFLAGPAHETWLLVGAGVITAVPLIVYANAAKKLRLSTVGILQYIAPTMIFLTAVLIFGEPFGVARMIAFPMIWVALVIYTVSLVHRARRLRRRVGYLE